MDLIKIVSLLFFLVISVSNGYRILAVFPFYGRSHMGVLEQIAKGLAKKGHQVDVISHFPLKKPFPNYTDITFLPDHTNHASLDYSIFTVKDNRNQWGKKILRNICDYPGLPEFSKIIEEGKTSKKYDLLLVHFISGYQCFTAIADLWKVPVVGVVTTSLYSWMNGFIGNPLNLAISPNNHLTFESENLTFWNRLHNVIKTYIGVYEFYKEVDEQQDFIKKHFGSNAPHYRELEKTVAMILTNSHHSYYGVKPKVPALIEIGGIHITNESSTMEPTLKALLDGSTNGFIYFSFGSLAVIETFPVETLQNFYAVFRKIAPVRIVMRSTRPERLPKNLPDNVFTYPWLPQQQILQHPNIKGFVSHGGAHGTQEAFYYAVPIICFPLFAEQTMNCGIAKKKNISVVLDFQKSTEKDYIHAFEEIIYNPKYKEASRKFSLLYRDRPRTPQEESTYWIEYVIRHGGKVLQSPAVYLKWWQIELLDVYAFLIACFSLALCIFIFIVRLMLRSLPYLKMSYGINVKRLSKKVN